MCCEASHFTGEHSAFLSLDLTKAYNLLCRPLLELLNEHYGTPESLRSLYFQFLRSLKRFFSICNGLSEAVYSTCGVPEGCPFSVYQMMSLNLFVIQLISHQQHLSATVMFSYADNWLFQAEILQSLHNTVEHVHAAARTCAFQIAPDKTWASTTSLAGRKAMKTWTFQNYPVQVPTHRLELGLTLVFDKKLHTEDVRPRVEAAFQRLERLQVHAWSIDKKISIIQRSVFSFLFAGAETQQFSKSFLDKLRGRCNRVLHSMGNKQAGHAGHFLGPLFTSHQDYEPVLFLLKMRLNSIRNTAVRFPCQHITTIWNHSHPVNLLKKPHAICGPVTIVMWTLQHIGFTLEADLVFTSVKGAAFHLLSSPVSAIYDVAKQAVFDRAIQSVSHKKEWQQAEIPAALWQQIPLALFKKFPLVAAYRTSSIMSAEAKVKAGLREDLNCELCGQTYSLEHLVTTCPALSHVRQEHGVASWQHLPLPCLATGLPAVHPCPPIDLPEVQSGVIITPQNSYHFFTDGSADPPDLKQATTTGWAVVQGEPGTRNFSLVCSGPLPGPMQNILRAETYALLQVLRQAVPCTVYCDNATVCQYFRDLLSEPFSLANWHTKADPDLWLEMSQLLFAMGPGLVWVQKVKAHLDVRHAQSDHEAWCILGNSQADAFAKKAHKTALQARLALQHKHHINSCRESLKHLPRIWAYLQALSEEVFASRRHKQQTEPLPPVAAWDPPVPSVEVCRLHYEYVPSPLQTHPRWDPNWLKLCLYYFSLLTWPPPHLTAGPISLIELAFDLLITFGVSAPRNMQSFRDVPFTGPRLNPNRAFRYYHLFPPHESGVLPKPQLREVAALFANTFKWLQEHHQVAPVKAEQLYSLRPVFSNKTMSLSVRPLLLNPDSVATALRTHIQPQNRSLNCFVTLPRPATPIQFPEDFPPDFRRIR